MPDLSAAINAFERRMKVSPTLRGCLDYPEYLGLIQAIVAQSDELRELTRRIVEMGPREVVIRD